MDFDTFFIIVFVLLAIYIVTGAIKRVRIREDMMQSFVRQVCLLQVEKHDNNYYWFEKETQKFIGQGQTVEELIAVIKAVHPNKVFIYKNFVLAGPDFLPVQIDNEKELINFLD